MRRNQFSAFARPTTASGTESTEAKYGLMSISGVPSRQSRPTTESVVPSTRTSLTTLIAIGFGRTGERTENVPQRFAVMPRRLHHEVAPRAIHEIENDEMRAGRDAVERGRVARIELDGAHGVRAARVLRAFVAPRPRRADAPDEIDAGVEFVRQRDGDLAGTKVGVDHGACLH